MKKETDLRSMRRVSSGKSSGVEKICMGERPVYIQPRSLEVKSKPWCSGELMSHTG